ncbi:hypothetical protein RB195_005534 [Necator americanus]|uniref:NADH dehydrogenase [ubiquinone] 1 beta subcomplex subunit 10 n=1 Tax=Necator americanus TaxID=51031 RepID=A0ABR1BNB6_NECAM
MGSSSLLEQRQAEDKAAWDAYWKLRDLDSRGTIFPRMRYYAHKAFDAPATWFRETIVEPINNRNRLPYYHRKLTRVPEIDECGVNDKACFFEANEQFRLDKMVDGFILQTLRHRVDRCLNYNDPDLSKCAKVIEDMEENELNFFIKYGELGGEADVRDAYMKQKHRLIWERRHPEIMEERKKALKEHKEKLAKGEFDYSFWKKGMFWQDKKNYEPPYEFYMSKSALEGDKPLSKDWQYYKKVAQDPEFDKQQGKTSEFLFPVKILRVNNIGNNSMLLTTCRSTLYKQGQYVGKIREYFYYINHEGMLFLDDSRAKNFTSAYKDVDFLNFFYKQLRTNNSDRFADSFPYKFLMKGRFYVLDSQRGPTHSNPLLYRC